MPNFKVTRVSTVKPPRTWNTKRGESYTAYKVMLEGVVDPVEVSVPSEKIMEVDSVIIGDIKSGEFGKSLVEWRPRKSGFSRDDNSIKAQFAIKAAIAYLGSEAPIQEIENTAKSFYEMVDRIKNKEADSPIDKVFTDTEPIMLPDNF